MIPKKVFVTVGTTKFPKLINTITTKPVIDTLSSLGYNLVQIQTGKDFTGFKIDTNLSFTRNVQTDTSSSILELDKIQIKYDQYFEDFEKEIESSDLVISHAGAGTCLEVLQKRKHLIVVINEELMDNHQEELAEELEHSGYLYYCNCENLANTLKKDLTILTEYPTPEKHLFPDYLDKHVGFIS